MACWRRSRAAQAPGRGIHVRHGKMVVELAVVPTEQGRRPRRIRQRVGASAVLFIGDDVTDEDAFATLTGPDVGVKVGDGHDRRGVPGRRHRRREPAAGRLAENRRQWLLGASAPRSSATCCCPTSARPPWSRPTPASRGSATPGRTRSALFAELLGGPAGGYFAVRPLQRDDPDRPALPARARWWSRPAGRASRVRRLPRHATRRPRTLVRVLSGFRPAVVEFAPRLDYRRAADPPADLRDDGLEVGRHLRPDRVAGARRRVGAGRGGPAPDGPGDGRPGGGARGARAALRHVDLAPPPRRRARAPPPHRGRLAHVGRRPAAARGSSAGWCCAAR